MLSRKSTFAIHDLSKNNCYRSTTLLFGLGWTIIKDVPRVGRKVFTLTQKGASSLRHITVLYFSLQGFPKV